MFIKEISLNQLEEFNQGSVFNSEAWLSLYAPDKISVFGIFNKNKELIGAFSLYKHKRAKIFTQLAPAPFMPTNGLFVIDNTTNPAQKNSFNKKVMELLSEFMEQQQGAIKTFLFPVNYTDMQPFTWKGYKVSPKYTYLLNLTEPEDKLLENMSPERRKNIKKAIKDGVFAKKEEFSQKAKELITNTFINQGLKVDYTVLDKILTSFSKNKNASFFVSYNSNNTPIAANFCVFDETKSYYLFGGYDNENKHEGAGVLAMWEAIKFAKEMGINTFDFEGSMVPQIEKYFRGFGGELLPYYEVKKQNIWSKIIFGLSNKK